MDLKTIEADVLKEEKGKKLKRETYVLEEVPPYIMCAEVRAGANTSFFIIIVLSSSSSFFYIFVVCYYSSALFTQHFLLCNRRTF